jgi:hypothetical protein
MAGDRGQERYFAWRAVIEKMEVLMGKYSRNEGVILWLFNSYGSSLFLIGKYGKSSSFVNGPLSIAM